MDLVGGKKFLQQSGLNRFALLEVGALPDNCRESLNHLGLDLHRYPSLLLLGSAGPAFWRQVQKKGIGTDNPFDELSAVLANQFVDDYLDGVDAQLIYPSQQAVPLLALGEHAGWSAPSQLGLGIHPDYGTWFAFRVVMLLATKLSTNKANDKLVSACLACTQKPCIRQCPAHAVHRAAVFDVRACVDYRQQTDSRCKDRCLARMACPVGPSFKYSISQMQYHASRSLAAILRSEAID